MKAIYKKCRVLWNKNKRILIRLWKMRFLKSVLEMKMKIPIKTDSKYFYNYQANRKKFIEYDKISKENH